MSEQIIKLTDNAAARIKEIMSNADNKTIGVRVGVKSGGCAGMSYSMEYAKDKKKNDEVIEDKGVKVFIDPAAIIYLLGTEMDYKKRNFLHNLFLKIQMRLNVADVESLLKFEPIGCNTSQIQLDEEYVRIYKSLGTLSLYKHLFDHQ